MADSELIDIAKDFLDAVNDDLNQITSEKGTVNKTNNGAVMHTPYYIQFAKYGRDKGKPPPVNALLDWVQKKGIAGDDKQALSIAFAISRTISKKGTLNHVKNAPNAIEEALQKHKDAYLKRLREVFTGYIKTQIKGDIFVEELRF